MALGQRAALGGCACRRRVGLAAFLRQHTRALVALGQRAALGLCARRRCIGLAALLRQHTHALVALGQRAALGLCTRCRCIGLAALLRQYALALMPIGQCTAFGHSALGLPFACRQHSGRKQGCHHAQGQCDSDDLLFHLTSSLSDIFCRLDISTAKRLFLPSKTILAYRAEVVT